jgi:hypothetical protein
VLTQQVYFLEFGVTDTDSRMDGWILSCSTFSKSVLVSAATSVFFLLARGFLGVFSLFSSGTFFFSFLFESLFSF